MTPAPKARRFTINTWGTAGLILFVGDFLLSAHSWNLQASGQAPLFSSATNYEQALVANVAAGVCAFIASRRGHWSWQFLVLLSAWGALVNFFGEL